MSDTLFTKAQLIDKLKQQLSTSKEQAMKALTKIYSYQTLHEQEIGATEDHNNVGFTGPDSQILTSFAAQLEKRGDLSEKQVNLLFRLMPKYSRQLIESSIASGLITVVKEGRSNKYTY